MRTINKYLLYSSELTLEINIIPTIRLKILTTPSKNYLFAKVLHIDNYLSSFCFLWNSSSLSDLGVDDNEGADASIAYGNSEKYKIYGRVLIAKIAIDKVEKLNKRIE